MKKTFSLVTLALSLFVVAPAARGQCFREGKFSTADVNDKYGRGLAVGRGFVAVGAPNDSSIFDQEGKVFVYRDLAGTWGLSATIQPAGLNPVDLFGFSVAAGGNLLAASALFDDAQGVDSGAVYVYRSDPGGWVLEQKLVNPAPGDQLNYGRTIDMSRDVLAVAKWGPPAVVYVYRRSGTSWTLEATLAPSFPDQRYGTDVAVAGNVIVVGDPEYGIQEGAIEVYRFTPGSGWASEYVVFGTVGSRLGESVAAYRDRVVAGTWGAGGGGGAQVHRYLTGSGTWTLDQALIGSDTVGGDGFGFSVAISASGVYVGAPGNDSLASNAGAVYAFTFGGGSWSQVNKVTPGDLGVDDNFGTTAASVGALLAVGNRFQLFSSDSRAVYVFASCP